MWVTKLPDCTGPGGFASLAADPRHVAHPAGNHPAGNLLTRRETLRYHQRRFI
jgi:hypothetical protein